MTRYTYNGPNSAITLVVQDDEGNPKDHEVMLWHGREVEMPADHEVTLALLAQGLLTAL